ncbi:MAG: SulP family inorganic anion transporter [Bryobacteraceae bacterium]
METTNPLRYDLPAGLVVFLVALPLCLGIALASGAPLFAGVIAGVVGGVVVSILSGSQVSVSGPAAGLVVIVVGSIQSLGSYKGPRGCGFGRRVPNRVRNATGRVDCRLCSQLR